MSVKIGVNHTNWGVPAIRPVSDARISRFFDESSEAGFAGVELSSNLIEHCSDDPSRLRHALERRGLELAGAVIVGPLEAPDEWPALERRARTAAETLTEFGSQFLVVIDALSIDEPPTPLSASEWSTLVDTIQRLGRLASDYDLRLAFHPHVDTHIETEDEIRNLLDETDPALVSLCLDVGQLAYNDIDPIRVFRDHAQRVGYLHLKNIRADIRDRHRKARLSWVQAVRDGVATDLTAGVVDLRGLRDSMRTVGYKGWAIAEMDRFPTPTDAPLQMAARARRFLREIGVG